ncbi:hypothetical protein H2199_003141 [Coniosporium tulheliwenetii]|nr:hypothetical protein H2199_003141 [Cladosporium sp. JES 115]
MKENLKKNFEEVGFEPEIQPLAYFQDDYGLKPAEGEEDEQPTEEEEESDDEDGSDEDDESTDGDDDESNDG